MRQHRGAARALPVNSQDRPMGAICMTHTILMMEEFDG
jgi:hypothetical protein